MNKSILESKKVMVLVALVCCLLWASAFPTIKISYAQLEAASPFTKILIAGLRFTLAGLMVLIFTRIKYKKTIGPEKKDWKLILTVGIMQTFFGYSMYYIGIGNTSAVKGSILVPSSVFMVIILSHFLLKDDKLTVNKIIGLIFGFFGILVANLSLLSGDIISFVPSGDGLILINCLMIAIVTIIIKKNAGRMNALILSGWQLLIGGILLIIVGLIGNPVLPHFNLPSIMILLYMAFISAIAFSLWFLLLQYHSATKITIYKFTIPIFGTTMSVLLLPNENFRIELIAALVLVSIGVIIVNKAGSIVKIKLKKRKDTT